MSRAADGIAGYFGFAWTSDNVQVGGAGLGYKF